MQDKWRDSDGDVLIGWKWPHESPSPEPDNLAGVQDMAGLELTPSETPMRWKVFYPCAYATTLYDRGIAMPHLFRLVYGWAQLGVRACAANAGRHTKQRGRRRRASGRSGDHRAVSTTGATPTHGNVPGSVRRRPAALHPPAPQRPHCVSGCKPTICAAAANEASACEKKGFGGRDETPASVEPVATSIKLQTAVDTNDEAARNYFSLHCICIVRVQRRRSLFKSTMLSNAS